MSAQVIPFRPRRVDPLACLRCGAEAVVIVYPHADHRRRKPWPQPWGLCENHRGDAK